MIYADFQHIISTNSIDARNLYRRGVESLLNGTDTWKIFLEESLRLHPEFALAHIALSRGEFFLLHIERAKELAALARVYARKATPREKSHVNCLALAIEGFPAASLEAIYLHIGKYPSDRMVLAPAAMIFGLIGFSGRQDRETEHYRLMRSLLPVLGQDPWFISMYALSACETGHREGLSEKIEFSLRQSPDNTHGIHAKAHFLYESGKHQEYYNELSNRVPKVNRNSLMHCHLSWHLAHSALTTGHIEQAWDIYHSAIHPGNPNAPPINVVTDSVSFLWRMELCGEKCAVSLWQTVMEYSFSHFPKVGNYFVDLHKALACIGSRNEGALRSLIEELLNSDIANNSAIRQLTVEITTGFSAFHAGDRTRAIEILNKILPSLVRIGGSRAQRDIVTLTIAAAKKIAVTEL